jgi:myo-inositol-1(or 4)-monophosphatase
MMDPRLDLAVSLALDAGRAAAAALGRVGSAWKRPGERVTAVDVEIQARMLGAVHTWFPGDGVVAEEAGQHAGTDREFVWVLDPLDGTNNFALGIPCFAVSIGILRAGEPYAGVVHDPNTGLTVRARRGAGAFSGERRLVLAARRLDGASNVCVRAPVAPPLRDVVGGWLARHKVRVFGSVALHLTYAALGGIDLVLDDRAAVWDVAAGGLILLEAGGRLTGLDGAPLFPLDLGREHDLPVPFLAGNAEAHGEALAVLSREARPRSAPTASPSTSPSGRGRTSG